MNKLTLEEAKEDNSLLNQFDKVRIYSKQWQMFWRENRSGYTNHPENAGIYDIEDAYKATSHCGEEKGIEFWRLRRWEDK